MKISVANLEDINEIMSYINNELKENHILAVDKDFFLFEFENKKKLNLIIAKVNGKLVGILGFMPFFIKKNKKYFNNYDSDFFTVLWKVSKDNSHPALGLELLNFLKNLIKPRILISTGINVKTIGLYKFLGMYTNKLNHFVIVNSNFKKFIIGKINYNNIPQIHIEKSKKDYHFKTINNLFEFQKINFKKFKNYIPFKNELYYKKRFLDHPIYNYNIIGLFNKNDFKSLIVTRIQEKNNSKILRIVDFFGNDKYISNFSNYIKKIILEENLEYADLYCFGVDNQILLDSGFLKVDSDSEELIIPNYFNPFIKKNIALNFFADTKETSKLRLFKGDGDQDRPSKIII